VHENGLAQSQVSGKIWSIYIYMVHENDYQVSKSWQIDLLIVEVPGKLEFWG